MINIQITITFLYISNKQLKFEVQNTVAFIIVPKYRNTFFKIVLFFCQKL
jgi:hypothetical protein